MNVGLSTDLIISEIVMQDDSMPGIMGCFLSTFLRIIRIELHAGAIHELPLHAIRIIR